METGNPFYVHPGGDYGPGLSGLAQTVRQVGEKVEKRETMQKATEKFAKMKADAITAYRTNDPDKMAEFSLKNPEMAQAMKQASAFRDQETEDNYKDSLFSFYVNPDEQNASEIVQSRQQLLQGKGVGSDGSVQTDGFYEKFMEDPERMHSEVGKELAFRYPDQWKSMQSVSKSDVPKPYTDMAKLNIDFKNNYITTKDYEKKKGKILNPKSKSKIDLTMAALNGDAEAKNVLDAMAESDIEMAKVKGSAAATGKIEGLQAAMDLDATAKAIIEGRETIDKVRNTFGVPIQEAVRQKVLAKEPDFNFVQPRAIEKSLNSSLMQQQKNRGMMGSFVTNINGQVDKLEQMSSDVVKRVGVRAMDIPIRELKTRFVGSGNERVFEAYMKEISAEIAKLAQGSAGSVAQLPEENRKEWEKIHDVNLSMKELLVILNSTREMANIRLDSVQSEIDSTVDKMGDVRGGKAPKTGNDPLGIR